MSSVNFLPVFLFVFVLFVILSLLALLLIQRKELLRLRQKSVLDSSAEPKQNKIDLVELRKIMLPVQMSAYERLILYLERMQPQVIMKRNYEAGLPLKQFQLKLLQNVREEFEHNLAQQLYVSENAWQLMKTAREELVQQINLLASQFEQDVDTKELASQLAGLQLPLIDQAIFQLKKEFQKLLVEK